jgi:thiamine transport system permease protein
MVEHRLEMKIRNVRIFAIPAAILVFVTAVIPLIVLTTSVIDKADIFSIWAKSPVRRALVFSLWQALLSTAFTIFIGVIATWYLSRYQFFGRRIFFALVTVPFVLPTVAVGAAFIAVLPKALHHSTLAIILAHIFFNISIVVRTVGPRWNSIDDQLIDSARTLGATPFQTWRHVIMPLGKNAIFSATALTFFMCFSSYGIITILGGPGLATLDIEIYRRAVQLGDLSGATVLAIAQMLLIAVAFFLWSRSRSTELITFRAQAVSRRQLSLAPKCFFLALTAFFTVPLFALVAASMRTSHSWSLTGWKIFLGIQNQRGFDFNMWLAIQTSGKYALIASCIAVPTGIAATYALSSQRASHARLSAFVILPLAISPVVIGLAILITYDFQPFDFRSSWLLIPVVHAAIALPFVMRSALPVIEGIPNDLRSAASTLGASPWRRFFTIELPLLKPAISTGLAFSLAMSLGEFGATSFLTRHESRTIPIIIASLFEKAGDIPRTTGMAASLVLIISTAMIVLAIDRKSHT